MTIFTFITASRPPPSGSASADVVADANGGRDRDIDRKRDGNRAGLGRWSEADFVRALRGGVRPDGAHYYPAFPYPAFTRITDADLRDLWAYLRSLPPSARANSPHELRFPFGWRPLVAVWKWLFFSPGPFAPLASRPPLLDRGAYLVEALGHCGECHTPRNFLGAPKRGRILAGTAKGLDGKRVPNLTPIKVKKWDDAELKDFLQTGLTPDGDVAGETMTEVIRNSTSQLTPDDLAALIAYLRALPPGRARLTEPRRPRVAMLPRSPNIHLQPNFASNSAASLSRLSVPVAPAAGSS